MQAESFDSSFQKLHDSSDGRLLEGFAQALCQVGYAEARVRRHIRAAEHVLYWTTQQGRTISTLNERFAEDFARHLNECRCPRYGRTDLQKGAETI